MSADPTDRFGVADFEQADDCERLRDLDSLIAHLSVLIFRLDPDLRFLYVSAAVESVFGTHAGAWLGRTAGEVGLPTDARGAVEAACREVFSSRQARSLEFTTNGRDFLARLTPEFAAEGSIKSILCIAQDVTERRRAEREQATADEFLRILNESNGAADLVQSVALFLQRRSGCEAVGIRLSQDCDYPYVETRGFPPKFVRLESQLCSYDQSGHVILDAQEHPALVCMRGLVIGGRFDPSKPFFSPGGSFWTNCTTELLASTSEADRQTSTRNRCHGMGYESVALIPLRLGDERIGLIQLNDRRKDRHSAESIALWERLASYLAVAISKSRANDALRQSEERLRLASLAAEATEERFATFMQHSPAIAWMKDEDGRYLYRSRPFERAFGVESEDFRGKTDLDFWPPETAQRLRENDLAVLAGGESTQVVEAVQEENGELSFWLNSKFPFQDGSGKRYVGGVGVDITERKRAEAERERLLAELREANGLLVAANAAAREQANLAEAVRADAERQAAQLNALLESLDEAVNIHDASGRLIMRNRKAGEITGIPEKIEGIHSPVPVAYLKLDGTPLPSDRRPCALALRDEKPDYDEFILVRADGSRRRLTFSTGTVRDEAGKIVLALGVYRDVTERREMERSIREREEQFRALAENSPDLIARFDREYRRLYVNAAVERHLEQPREHLIGIRHRDSANLQGYVDLFESSIQRVLDTGREHSIEYRSLTRYGDVWYHQLLSPEFGADGSVETVLSVCRDVTALHDATEQLRQLTTNLELEVEKRTAELQVSSAELDAFSYSVSHNVRAPLRHLQGFAQALVEDYGDRLDENGRNYANRLGEAALRLDGLIRDLVSYARICRDDIRPERLTLMSVAGGVDEWLGEQAKMRGLRLSLSGLEEEFVADRTILAKVLSELVDNAGKFAAPGREPEARIWAEPGEGGVRLFVADNGVGIAPEHQDRVFQMFEQLRPVGEGEGNGIGLAIVKKGVEKLGGTVGVESVLGEGSRFWIELPAATHASTADAVPEASVTTRHHEARATAKPAHGPR